MGVEDVGIGIIGAGLIGTLHSLSLKTAIGKMELGASLAHVADLDGDKAERMRNAFGFGKASADPLELIRDPNVDAIYICTWTSAHPELVEAAAAHGKHVFCEKPLAFDAADAARMREALDSRGLINQVGLVLRQGPIWNVARQIVKEGDAGFPVCFIFRDDQCFPIKGAHPSEWRKDPARSGHGTVIEHSIHDLDLLEWTFGRVDRVRARTAERFGHAEIEDLAFIELEFESGMAGDLVSIWHDVEQRHSNRRLEVFNEKLFVSLECEFTGPIDVQEGAGALRTISADDVNRRFWEIRGIEDPVLRELSLHFGVYQDYLFLKALIDGVPVEAPDFGVAVRAHELVDAVYGSAADGDWVSTSGAALSDRVK